jgi:hypothetical protein
MFHAICRKKTKITELFVLGKVSHISPTDLIWFVEASTTSTLAYESSSSVAIVFHSTLGSFNRQGKEKQTA